MLSVSGCTRRRRHYIVDRNVNYTKRLHGVLFVLRFLSAARSPEGYLEPLDSIFQKIEETLALGGTGVLMQGGCIRT